MKKIFTYTLKYILKYTSKLVLLIHRPRIIVVAGSVNKTFVKERVRDVLKKRGYSVRANSKNFNTEIGLPLAILNLPSAYSSYVGWLKIIFKAIGRIFQFKFPKYLVLELGVSDRGDMKYLLSIVKPSVVIITDITKRYMEGFRDLNCLLDEYKYLVNKISSDGLVILNNDNNKILEVLKNFKAKKITYGIEKQSDWQAIEINKNKDGQSVKILNNNIINNYDINRFGEHHVYAFLVELAIQKNINKI